MHNVIKQVEDFAKPFYDKAPDGVALWDDHIRLVRKFAIKLAKIEKADSVVVEIAAILHDLGKDKVSKNHSERSCEIARPFLNTLSLNKEKKDLITKCILKHSSRFSKEDNEIEIMVLQSADALGTFFDENWQAYSRKILNKEELLNLYEKSFNKINLKSAIEIVKPQINRLKKLLEQE